MNDPMYRSKVSTVVQGTVPALLGTDRIFPQINRGLSQRVLNPLTSFYYLLLGRAAPFSFSQTFLVEEDKFVRDGQ